MKEIEKARQMNILEKKEEIDNLEEKVNQQKKENSWLGLFGKKIDDFMKE